MLRSICVLLVMFLTAASAVAQEGVPPDPGNRVRVSHRCNVALKSIVVECADTLQPRSATGRFVAVDDDFLRIRTTAWDELAIPVQYVDAWFLSAFRRSELRKGVVLGFVGGGLLGAAVGSQVDFASSPVPD